MTTQRAALPPGAPSPGPGVPAVHTALFVLPADARRAELKLGQLSADAGLDVLDAVVVDWPADSDGPRWRAAHNVPRLGALAQTAWDKHISGVVGREPQLARQLRLGATAILVIVDARHDVQLAAELRSGVLPDWRSNPLPLAGGAAAMMHE